MFFNLNKELVCTHLLQTEAHHLCNKYSDIFKNNEIKKNIVAALCLDEINIQIMVPCTNKACTFRIPVNSAKEMEISIQAAYSLNFTVKIIA